MRQRKGKPTASGDLLREEYDFSSGVRGKHSSRYASGTNVVVLEPDVASVFPTAKEVNDALRLLAAKLRGSGKSANMERYLNRDSAVTAYEIGSDFIRVRFGHSSVYVYDYVSPGQHHVEQMKKLAVTGRGLGTYISQNVHNNYARKE